MVVMTVSAGKVSLIPPPLDTCALKAERQETTHIFDTAGQE